MAAAKKAAARSAAAPRVVASNDAPRVNPHRGEVAIVMGGKPYKLLLTLNALVEIEECFGKPLAELGEVLTKPSMRQVRTLLAALVRGGGATVTVPDLEARQFGEPNAVKQRPINDDELGALPFNIAEATDKITQAFIGAGVMGEGGEANDDENP